MSFYGSSFIFNDVPSEQFSLRISELDASAVNSAMAAFDVEIYEQKIYRRSTPFFYGVTGVSRLEFEMSCYSEKELTAEDFSLAQRWLFGQNGYKKLQIVQPDMQDVYWWAILNSTETTKVGNLIQGCKFTVNCNSPFGFKFPKTITYSYSSNVVDSNKTFYNASDDVLNYLYPTTVITMNNSGGNIAITNQSDGNRVFQFTGLQANEVLTVDNGLQTISSSTGLKRMNNFNKKWLRFVPSVNQLRIQGNVLSIANTFSLVAKKIGG